MYNIGDKVIITDTYHTYPWYFEEQDRNIYDEIYEKGYSFTKGTHCDIVDIIDDKRVECILYVLRSKDRITVMNSYGFDEASKYD